MPSLKLKQPGPVVKRKKVSLVDSEEYGQLKHNSVDIKTYLGPIAQASRSRQTSAKMMVSSMSSKSKTRVVLH